MAALNAGDKAYIVENNRIVRECTVVRVTGNLIIIRFENGGGIQVNKSRLFPTREAADQSVARVHTTEHKMKQSGFRSPYDYWH